MWHIDIDKKMAAASTKKSQVDITKSHRSDLKYKEIKLLLKRKEREKRENAETLIEEL